MTLPIGRAVSRFASLIERLEELPVGPAGWAGGFLSICAIRHLLEIRTSQYPLYPPSAFYVHYILAYLAPLLTLSLVLSTFSSVRLERVLRLMLLAWSLILLPPTADAILARAHEAHIGYLDLGETPIATVFVHFFDPTRPLKGTTPGIRLEAALACLLGAVYVSLRAPGRRVIRALGAALAVYVTALCFFTLPSLYLRVLRWGFPHLTLPALYSTLGRVPRPVGEAERGDQSLLVYLVPLTLVLGAIALARARPRAMRAAARHALVSEGWSWALACAAGAAVGWRILDGVPLPIHPAPFDYLALAAGPLAMGLAGAALALIARNNNGAVADATVSVRAVGWSLLAAAGILAAAASTDLAAMGTVALGAGFLARGLPVVLPRAILLPQVAAGFATLAAFIAGYALTGGAETLVIFPAALLIGVFLLGALADFARLRPDDGRLGALVRSVAAATPLAALIVPTTTLGGFPNSGGILVAILLSGGFLAGSFVLPPRVSGALALAGALIVLCLSVADPARVAGWRGKALTSPVYFIRLSQRAETAGDLQAASGAASEAVKRDPGLAATHHRLGLVRSKRGDYEGAVSELRRAVELDPKDAALLGNLATALLDVGKGEEALMLFDRALALDPSLLVNYYNRARCLDMLHRSNEAEGVWRDLIARSEGKLEQAGYVEIARRRLVEGPPK